MSPQDSLTSTRQDKANWNSRRPLFLACARFGGGLCLSGPAGRSLSHTWCAGSEALKGHFLYPQSWATAAWSSKSRLGHLFPCVNEPINLEAQTWPSCCLCLGIAHFWRLRMRRYGGNLDFIAFWVLDVTRAVPLILQLCITLGES